MPKKGELTGQQEIFCREYVRTGVASAAYRIAYKPKPTTKPESIWSSASETLAIPKVRQRIEEITAEAAARAGVTKESMLIEMAQNRAFAQHLDNPSAAQSASRDRAKVAGLLKETLEHTGKDGAAIVVEEQVSLEERSANDLARRLAHLLRKGQKAKATA